MGPVISAASLKRIQGMVNHAVASGATVRAGAKTPIMSEALAAGHYYEPTVLEVTPSMEIWREEVIQHTLSCLFTIDPHIHYLLTGIWPCGCCSAIR